jgi:hypothetical protein
MTTLWRLRTISWDCFDHTVAERLMLSMMAQIHLHQPLGLDTFRYLLTAAWCVGAGCYPGLEQIAQCLAPAIEGVLGHRRRRL